MPAEGAEPTIIRHDFATAAALADALAGAVAEQLRAGIAGRGVATLAVSGGRTPDSSSPPWRGSRSTGPRSR